jgi:hypothetical protein
VPAAADGWGASPASSQPAAGAAAPAASSTTKEGVSFASLLKAKNEVRAASLASLPSCSASCPWLTCRHSRSRSVRLCSFYTSMLHLLNPYACAPALHIYVPVMLSAAPRTLSSANTDYLISCVVKLCVAIAGG